MPIFRNRPSARLVLAISTIIASAVVLAYTLHWLNGPAQETTAPPARVDLPRDPIPGARPGTEDVDLAVAGITGTVRDLDGRPLAGARVCAWRLTAPWPNAERATPQCTEAAPDGFYVLPGLPPLRHAIHASAPQHRPARLDGDLSLRPGEHRGNLDFALAPGGVRVAGVVQDISGGVVEGAWVSSGDGQGPGTASARSDAAGRFVLWVGAGFVHLVGQADGYADATEYGSAPGEAYVLRLTPESVLVGEVVLADTRAPVAGARVTVIGELGEAGAVGMGVTYTDAAGKFRLARLQPGVYKPRVQADG
ncbi:MAG TPA: carboxypeptidase-like regulatory domain-containing protein, partial [Nannocystis sp.]